MKKTILATLILISTASYAKVENPTVNTSEANYKASVLIDNLNNPWDMVWGSDGNIWVTERQGKHISTVNPETGVHKVLYTLENAFVAPPQQGVLGLALHPNFMKGSNEDYVYAYYTYSVKGEK